MTDMPDRHEQSATPAKPDNEDAQELLRTLSRVERRTQLISNLRLAAKALLADATPANDVSVVSNERLRELRSALDALDKERLAAWRQDPERGVENPTITGAL